MKTKDLKRLLVLIMSGILILGTACMPVAASGSDAAVRAAADSSEDGSEDSSDDSTPEIEDGTVLISTAEDLCWFAEQIAAGTQYDAILVDDIDASESLLYGIGYIDSSTDPVAYAGTFDGNNKTVTLCIGSESSYTDYAALFAMLDEDGVIRNLNISGSVCGGKYTASAVSYADGGLIENISSDTEIYGASVYTGGIVGYGCNDPEIIGCSNAGTVYGTSSGVGGIIGVGKDTIVIGCVNYGSVSTGSFSTGGIAGILSNSSGECIIAGCMNYGAVSGRYRIGGILGISSANELDIRYCGNTGAVSANYNSSSRGYYAGGVAAELTGSAAVNSCFNTGDVSGTTYLGGVAGEMNDSAASMTNCYNRGEISTTGSYVELGGVLAYMNVTAELKNCYNTGYLSYDTGVENLRLYMGAVIGCLSSTGSLLSNTSNNYASADVRDAFEDIYEIKAIDYNTSATESNASYVEASVLCAADTSGSNILGDAYKADTGTVNDGYLILAWQGCGASDVTALIEAADTLDAVEYAYAAYYALDADEQSLVTNIDDLADAYNDYTQMVEDTQKVINLIEAIGEVTLSRGTVITAARAAYDALSDTGKSLITNYDTLVAAESTYNALLAAETMSLIDAIGEVTLESGDAIAAARASYDDLSEDAQALVTNYDVLTEAEAAYAQLLADAEEDSDTENPDTENPDTENPDTENSDTENSDTENSDTGNSDTENSDTENSDTENSDTENSDTENSDTENSDTENAEQGDTGSGDGDADGTDGDGSSAEDSQDGSGDADGSGSVNTTNGKSKVSLSKGKIKKLKNKKGRKVKVTYKKDSKAGGYQIVYSTKKNFKNKKKVTVKSKKKTSVTLKKLKKNKKYYVKVRSYKKVGSKTYYGAWSKVKSVKVKK